MTYNRERLIIEFYDGKIYKFILEENGLYENDFIWNEEGKSLVIRKIGGGNPLYFPLGAIRVYYKPMENWRFEKIDNNTFEVDI